MLRQPTLLAFGLMAFLASFAASARNVVFLNNPSPQDVKDIGHYVVASSGKPFFSDLVLLRPTSTAARRTPRCCTTTRK